MKSYNQIEAILYNHYEKIKDKEKYEYSLERTRNRIQHLNEALRECRFTLSSDLQSIDYSKDLVITSKENTSTMERELIREETKIERELENEVKYKFALKRKIRNLQKQIDNVEVILKQLPINYIPFIESLYKDKLTYRGAGYILHCGRDTVGRNKNEIIKRLMEIL